MQEELTEVSKDKLISLKNLLSIHLTFLIKCKCNANLNLYLKISADSCKL